MPRKDDAGIYYFDHGNHVSDEEARLLEENQYLRNLVEAQKKEIKELKKQLKR